MRQTMKRHIFLLSALLSLILLAACGSDAAASRSMPEAEDIQVIETTPAPTAEPTPTPTPSPAPTATPTAVPSPTPSATPTPTATPKPTATPSPTPAPTDTPDPTAQPTPTPAPVHSYVLNTSSHKFHDPDCSSVGDMKDKNKEYFTGTRAEVIAMGYDPCGRCKP